MEKNIKILVATHKKYQMPDLDIYLPVFVGANKKNDIGFLRDDNGVNISEKNYCYCELTGLYYAWKNWDYDYLGLMHYRRYLKGNYLFNVNSRKKKIANYDDISKILDQVDVILPKKRNYVIESNESQYRHAHHGIGLDLTLEAIKELYPEYLDSYNKVMKLTSGHRFNIFIMKKELINDYCSWLFAILKYVEEHVDITNWSKSEQRIFGYLSERLLDVWLDNNKIKYKELPCELIEKSNNFVKMFKMIKRKMVKIKYDEDKQSV